MPDFNNSIAEEVNGIIYKHAGKILMAGRLPSNRTGYCWHLQVLISSIVLVQVIIMTDRLKFSATDAAIRL